MPKKRQKPIFPKPINTAHHTLSSSARDPQQNARSRSSHASASLEPSVNDLISHLRRTQVSSKANTPSQPSTAVPRSVHPALRNVLEVPDTPPPRPRPNARRIGIGGPRVRRTPGPPPPESWLVGSSASGDDDEDNKAAATAACTEREILYRFDRLPGATFPAKNRLLHLVLKSMALNWTWHVEYDGQFLGLLPSQTKVLLLSYIAIYSRGLPLGRWMRGLRPLFQMEMDLDGSEAEEDLYQDTDPGISRLDLGGAIGHWMTFKQLTRELVQSRKPVVESVQRKDKDAVPASWEEDYDDEAESNPQVQVPLTKGPSKGPRFENLRFLSLAHPDPASASWKSLISLMSHLSTLTHLSLAYWPVPTLTPNAINTRIRHPTQSSISFAYSGTDAYSAFENNWAEASSVLRKLSRVTYCLKWLDLEGCGDWIPALNWEETSSDAQVRSSSYTGPEWNGSWRNIEYVRLGPGWLPRIDAIEQSDARQIENTNRIARSPSPILPPQFSSRSLAWSIHAPSATTPDGVPSSSDGLPWDVDEERIKYRQTKELERFREIIHSAKIAQRHILGIRKQGRGKWVHFSFGVEDLGIGDLRKLFGRDYVSVLP